MSRYWDKGIEEAQATVASIGTKPERPDDQPMTRDEVESFIKGFGAPPAAVKRIVSAWMADQDRAQTRGWESHADSVYYDEH